MSYDAVGVSKALERPSVRLPWRVPLARILAAFGILPPGRTFTGRLLSHAEWLTFQKDFDRAAKSELPEEEMERLFRCYLEAIGIPAGRVLSLPPSTMLGVMEDFLACQYRALAPNPGREPEGTPANSAPSGSRTTP